MKKKRRGLWPRRFFYISTDTGFFKKLADCLFRTCESSRRISFLLYYIYYVLPLDNAPLLPLALFTRFFGNLARVAEPVVVCGSFFSIPQLMRSWFSPWKRIVERREKKWDFEDLASFIIIGFISRIVGFIIRSLVIIIGLASLLVLILGGVITYVFWITAPLIIILLLGFGLFLLIA